MDDWSITKVVATFATGFCVIAGVGWQILLYKAEKRSGRVPLRVSVPMILGAFWAISVLCWQLIDFFDEYGFAKVVDQAFLKGVLLPFLLAITFAIIFTLKCYFGPALVGSSLAISVFRYWEYDKVDLFPIFSAITEWVSSSMSANLQIIYFSLLLLIGLSTSVKDTFDVVDGDHQFFRQIGSMFDFLHS